MNARPIRQQLLARDLMQCREHAAENAVFNRQSPSAIVREQLAQYARNQRADAGRVASALRDVAESEPVPPPLTRRQLVVSLIGWFAVMAFSCWLAGWTP